MWFLAVCGKVGLLQLGRAYYGLLGESVDETYLASIREVPYSITGTASSPLHTLSHHRRSWIEARSERSQAKSSTFY